MGEAFATPAPRQSARFLALFGIAWGGSCIAYVPLLTLLLPVRMTEVAGSADVQWLALTTFGGAIMASLANIAFGWASDTRGPRRRWIAVGLALTILLLMTIATLRSPMAIVAAIFVWQVVLNLMLAPLAAWAADTVPDSQKGLLGGLISFGPAFGAASSNILTAGFVSGDVAKFGLLCLIIAALVLPLLLFGRPVVVVQEPAVDAEHAPRRRVDLALMWASRLTVQVADSVLFAFLFYYFRSLADAPPERLYAQMISAVMAVSIPVSLLVGRYSDRIAARRPFLVGYGIMMCAGLAVMSGQHSFMPAVAGYALFGIAAGSFLSLHSSYTMQLLPRPGRRGRDLGFFNLTNTLPSLVAPMLVIAVVPGRGYGTLMLLLAALMLLATVLIAMVRERT